MSAAADTAGTDTATAASNPTDDEVEERIISNPTDDEPEEASPSDDDAQVVYNEEATASTGASPASNGEVRPDLQPMGVEAMMADECDETMYDGREPIDDSKPQISSTTLQGLKNYHIAHDRWFGWFRGYVRQDWETISVPDAMNELKADWGELFFDLIYVACIVHISAEASYSVPADEYASSYDTDTDTDHRRLMGGGHGQCFAARRRLAAASYDSGECSGQGDYEYLPTAFFQFMLMVKGWEGMVYYTTYFVMNQKMDDMFRVLYMICVVCMGIFVKDDPAYMKSFLVSYAFLQAVSILRYLKVAMIPRSRMKAYFEIAKSAIIILAIIIMDRTVESTKACAIGYWGIYFGIWVFEEIGRLAPFLWAPLFPGVYIANLPPMNMPMNVPHFAERNGLFVTLILGEAIIASMLSELDGNDGFDMTEELEFSGAPPDIIVLAFLIVSFVMTYVISRLYYDCQPPEEEIIEGEDNHAMRRSTFSALLYIYSHQLLFVGLLGLGMGIKITASNIQAEDKRQVDVALPGYAIAMIVLALFMIRWAHPFESSKNIRLIWVLRVIIWLVMLVTPVFWNDINQGGLFLVYLVSLFILLALDFEGQERIKHQKEQLKVVRKRSSMSPKHTKHTAHTRVQEKLGAFESGMSKV